MFGHLRLSFLIIKKELEQIMFFNAFRRLVLERYLLEKRERIVPVFCVGFVPKGNEIVR